MRNGGKGSVDGEEWIDGGASGQIMLESGERRWRRSRLFWLCLPAIAVVLALSSGDLWLTDNGRCLGFDGRRFMIRLVVVASGSVTEKESRQPWTVAAG